MPIHGDGPGRPWPIFSPSCWSFLLTVRLCGGCLQSCWWCVTLRSSFISAIIPQLDCCRGNHSLCGVWWDSEFSCLTICEINSHSAAAKKVLHHRPQYGWVQLYIWIYRHLCYALLLHYKVIWSHSRACFYLQVETSLDWSVFHQGLDASVSFLLHNKRCFLMWHQNVVFPTVLCSVSWDGGYSHSSGHTGVAAYRYSTNHCLQS